jgi:hypothetical protein
MTAGARTVRSLVWLGLAACAAACREGTSNTGGGVVPIVASGFGTQGCAPSVPVPATVVAVHASPAIGPESRIVAVAGAETLYLTGSDGSIHRLDFPGGGAPPLDTPWVDPGVIEAGYLLPAGITEPARLSGLAILDDATLAVVEHTSNSLIHVSRVVTNEIGGLAGLPLAVGGNSDGVAGQIRFNFDSAAQILTAADGALYVTDTGNHTIRKVEVGTLAVAQTIAGTGVPSFSEGSLQATGFDTPSGLATSCGGELLVTEAGAAGLGGHRLRSLAVGGEAFFGGFQGSSLTLGGDGTPATTQGIDAAAQLASPVGLAGTVDGVVFWIDSATGILRRYDFTTGLSDCPMFADCASAVAAGGSFTNGGGFSLAITSSGTLYVLDGSAGTLYRVDP